MGVKAHIEGVRKSYGVQNLPLNMDWVTRVLWLKYIFLKVQSETHHAESTAYIWIFSVTMIEYVCNESWKWLSCIINQCITSCYWWRQILQVQTRFVRMQNLFKGGQGFINALLQIPCDKNVKLRFHSAVIARLTSLRWISQQNSPVEFIIWWIRGFSSGGDWWGSR